MIKRMLLFGATGDLVGRCLLPALAHLQRAGQLPADFRVVGTARKGWDGAAFQRHAAQRLDQHAADVPADARQRVVRALRYRSGNIDDPGSVASMVRELSGGAQPIAVYLALPQGAFATAVTTLGAAGLPEGSRIAVEKPFGEDLDGAMALNALLAQVSGDAGEQAVFRVDHVLGLATMQNLLGLRFANRMLEPLWNSAHIERIEILLDETLALEGRAGFYDKAGALRDVMQNHMLQELCYVAMEPPASLGEHDLRDRKVDVLRAIRPLAPGDMVSQTRRARYTAGRLGSSGGADGRAVPSYADEDGVDPARGTETYAEVTLEIDNERWAGTPFVLRTGKALAHRHKGVIVRFRPVTNPPFGNDTVPPAANEVHIGLDGPEDIVLRLTGNAAGFTSALVPLTLSAPPIASALPAYSRVLLEILSGGNTLSVRGDEAEESWRVFTPILQAWANGLVPLEEYPAGSDGPPRLDAPDPTGVIRAERYRG
jgi:glucose-6-phosphate 1-dehydrogenase